MAKVPALNLKATLAPSESQTSVQTEMTAATQQPVNPEKEHTSYYTARGATDEYIIKGM